MKPRPIRLGGVPIGVASPPIDAANDVISMSAVAYCREMRGPPSFSCSKRKPRIDIPIANIMAVVAVLEIQAEMNGGHRAEREEDA